MEDIKLTQYSHGAGCGCKIAPNVLENILHSKLEFAPDPLLLVGNATRDDAAVYDMGNGEAVISTTDFFMPIVDNPEDFGGIASVNAISDIYAMGGTPVMAIAILGWPIDKLPAEVAQRVLEGSRRACMEAGIPLSGGHSIDAPEPIFGLAVTGRVKKENLKRNDQARPDSLLYLTKPLGVGIVTTAQKRGIVRDEHLEAVKNSMLTLNSIGAHLGSLPYVNGLTDVTGFGLLGHLGEICEGAGVRARVHYDQVPRFDFLQEYLEAKSFPGGTKRNLASYGHQVRVRDENWLNLLADPQTSGGLLVSIDRTHRAAFEQEMLDHGFSLQPIGELIEKGSDSILIEVE